MKLFNKILSTLFIAGCVSCSLDEVPTTSLVSTNVFTSEIGAEAVMNNLYQGLTSNSFFGTAWSYNLEGCSLFRSSNTTTPLDYWFEHGCWSIESSNASEYKMIFGQIGQINLFIDGVMNSNFNDDMKSEYIGEARLLRAFFYFLAARLWGDVPLILEAATSPSQANLPRTKYTEVYKAILDDLDYAESHVNSKDVQDLLYPDLDRCCNFAATALKAKVYVQIACLMENKDDNFFNLEKGESRYPDFSNCGIPRDDVKKAWTLALETAEKTIKEGPFELEPDFRNLFRYDPINHPEDFRSKERIITATISPKSSVYFVAWAAPNFYAQDRASNGNQRRVIPSRWTWENWCKRYGGTLKSGKQTDIGEYSWYDTCPDPRLDETYLHHTYYTATSATNETPKICYAYPYWKSESTKNENFITMHNSTTNPAKECNLVYKKRLSPRYQGAGKGGDADQYLLRLGDVYLLAAEAAASLGDLQKACDYVNVIHKRARQSVDDPVHAPAAQPKDWNATDFTQETIIPEIMWERVFEMDGEAQEWFDSHRRGATYLANLSKDHNAFFKQPANIRLFKYFGKSKDRVETVEGARKGLLMAFPEYELLNNTSLSYANQNDFYNK